MKIDVAEAETRLAELIEAAEAGEDIVIARNGTPIVRLVPVAPRPRRVGFAADVGPIGVAADDFDAPLPEFDEYSW